MMLLKQMPRWLTGMVGVFLFSFRLVWAAPLGISLQTSYEFKGAQLSTEKAWEIDPKLKNPHLRRQALGRRAELFGLKSRPIQGEGFGVVGREVRSTAYGYIRGPGPWYRPWEEFDCHGKVNSWFAQPEGAERALTFVADLWARMLKEKLPELDVLLSQVRSSSEAKALDRGEQVFRSWLLGVESLWREQCEEQAQIEEWKYYREVARSSGICQNPKSIQSPSPSRASLMEPVQGQPPSFGRLLARAPVRLWNGLFSIRANISFAGKVLNGRFLVDSTAKTSQVSPAWLDAQGIYPALIYAPGNNVEVVQRSRVWQSNRRLARRVRADRVEVSGLSLELRDFLLTETEFFNPPGSVGNCCDGILGIDFLRLYPMEFRSASPPEVRIWSREGFRGGEGSSWTELSELSTGELASACSLGTSGHDAAKSLDLKVEGVSWDLASEKVLEVHTPWRSVSTAILGAQKQKLSPRMVCDGQIFAEGFKPSFAEPPGGSNDRGFLSEKEPGMSLGVPLLSQSTFTLDIPHGRIWFAPGTLPLKEKKKNTSGVRLNFSMKGDERILKVQSLISNSPAASLVREGLKSGMVITQVDSLPAEELDQWEVDQRLSGAYGSQVTLQWRTKTGLKVALLTLGSAER